MISAAARQRRKEKREQKRAEFAMTIAQFSLEGRFCMNCKHIAAAPFPGKGRICSLNSDHEGYMSALPNGICTDHAFRADRASKGE